MKILPSSDSQGSSSYGTSPSMLQGASESQSSAWDRLVACYSDLMAAWCRSQGLDATATEDVVQESLLSVAKGLSRFRSTPGAGSFRAWLYKIVQRRIADHRRRWLRQPRAVGGSSVVHRMNALCDVWQTAAGHGESGSSHSSCTSVIKHLQQAMDQIACHYEARTWQAFTRSVIDGRTTDEVATEFNMTAAGVRQLRSRILRHLRRTLT